MCIEDVRMARMTTKNQAIVAVPVTSVTLLGSSSSRFAVVISPPAVGMLTLTLTSPAVSGQGINLSAGADPLILTLKDHGSIIFGPIYAIKDLLTSTIGILESNLNAS